MPTEALRIRGEHNVANALAALALCRAIGLPMAPLLHALRDYRGEPHRVELIGRFGEVDYFDDSKGTNVGATVAALNGLAPELAEPGRIVLIAGGDGKGQDFSPLAEPVAQHVRAVFLIGKDAGALRTALEGGESRGESGSQNGSQNGSESPRRLIVENCSTLEDAVARAVAAAQPKDIVLLSPACASLDMFRDYKHRAEVFVEAVRRFAVEAEPAC